MKTFKKVLASALAAAMVVTAFPVTNAEAATKAKLSATKATIYVGQSKTIKVTLPKGAKITSVKTSKKAVATVKKSGKKVVVKAVKAGKATVTVKVTPKKGKATNLKATITVKNPTLTVKAAATELAVGETTTITAKATPKKTVSFKSADETIATVDAKTGVVTAVKAGTVKITATAGKLTKDVELTIKNVIFKDVKQTKADTLEAVIAGDTKSLKADDVKITNTKTNVVYAVKTVAVDKADATKVTITTFVPMKDANDYSVVIADTTKTFTATDGKIVAVAVTTTTIPYATLSTISAVATDASGVELAEITPSTTTVDSKAVTFTVTPAAGGYTTGAQLYLAKKGDVAKAKVTIKSGEYDNTGKEINNIESTETEITAVDQEQITVSDFKARISTETGKSYDEVKENASLSIGDQGYAYFKITNSKNEAATYTDYKVESSNSNVLVVEAKANLTATDAKKGSDEVKVYGVATGTAYLIVKDTKNKDAIVATIPVTVNAARTVNSLSLDKTSVVLSTSDAVGTETVKVTVKDQYDAVLASDSYIFAAANVELLSGTVASAPSVSVNTDKNAITFATNSSIAVGTYTYKVTVKSSDSKIERSQVVKVDVKAPTGTTVAYAFEVSGVDASNSVDATLNDKFDGNAKTVTIKVVETKGGVKNSYVSVDNIVVKKDDKAVAEFSTGASGSTTATFTAIDVASNIVTSAAAGTYVVSGKYNDGSKEYNIAPTTFVVKNDTAKVTATQTANTFTSTLTTAADLCKSFDFYFGSKKLEAADITVDEVKAVVDGAKEATVTTVTAGKVAYITNVKLTVKFDGTNSFYVTVPVNKSVTVK